MDIGRIVPPCRGRGFGAPVGYDGRGSQITTGMSRPARSW